MKFARKLLLLTLLPAHASAQERTLTVSVGTNQNFDSIVGNLLNFMAVTIEIACVVMFMVGALFMVVSRGKDDQLQKGKGLMIGSLTGLIVVFSAHAIVRTLVYFLYS